ncbi:M1 family aminopeptidase [Geodermatophilus sabuli]|uniref:Peptidase family M1 n=1 Tax=Geodermatophilus sabuli TaxID=1564158 RepID=A0A285EG21_9ACTN|nr:M1 family aminopeptidase [Geodermatophilus sabuli]MBB3083072.1 aminopeptidase N [Geodermatophilus sabuli]SNX98069.1 Peptidase family M1 [Geodermatophilus sabuli]
MLDGTDRWAPGRRWAAGCGAALLLLAGCTSSPEERAEEAGPAADCATAERAAPDPDRPRVVLDFRLEDDLRTVTGTETLAFTPDRQVGELWFRLIPNAPQSAGHELRVDAVRGDLVAGGRHVDAEAASGTPGGLYRVGLREPVQAGETVSVELDFTLRLTTGGTPAGFDRLGVAEGVTWWAGGFPLLTWEPGHGWARDPFSDISGETTAATVADTTIRVSAPGDLTVLMTGAQEEARAEAGGRRLWESHEPVARDVNVAVGEFETAQVQAGDTAVTAGVLPGADTSAEELAEDTAAAIALLEARFGPFPYPTLTVPLVADDGGGEEYPSSILLGNEDFGLVVHEVAHMWFYGMVGNSQFRDPWLDEAFATYAESIAADEDRGHDDDLDRGGPVAGTMAEFTDQDDYEWRAYSKGAAALHAARDAAGPEAFDEAIRCYVETQAWTIARPEDLARALAGLQPALDVLVGAGALDRSHVEAAGE